jgi:aryl-alcohol dehydrogenase-like predicted oxidoreductase
MRYRLLGGSGLRVSQAALGTMTFGDDWGWGADAATSRRIFERFAEAGGNFIDTACNYTDGSSERILGSCLAEDRDRFVVATKYALTTDPTDLNAGGNHRKNLMRTVAGSLERLGTDYIDILYLHMWDDTTPLREVLRGLDDLVRRGAVHHVAFSDTPAWVVSRAVTLAEQYGWSAPVAVQVPYSLLSRSIERDVLPMAHELRLEVLVWGVLGGGVLTGKHLGGATEGTRVPSIGDRTRGRVDRFVEIAERLEVEPAALAVAWASSHPLAGGPMPILGARTVEQLDQQLDGLDVDMAAEVYAELSGIAEFELGFPRDFLESGNVQDLIFGPNRKLLDLRG